jgi:MFS family permease
VGVQGYRRVLALAEVRRVLVLSLVMRIPMWAANVILTLHVVSHLHRSYAAAGLLTGLATVALAISGPWRGRRLDRVGLRRTVAPSLVVLAACWSVAPFVSYPYLLLLAPLGGLFVVPSFSIVRQALIHAVPETQRRTVLSIDSVFVEISFMIGPVIGVLLATYADTAWALFACEFASIGGGVVLWLVNIPLRSDESKSETPATDAAPERRTPDWLTPQVVAVLLAVAAATLVLTGSDVGIVAALRHMGHQSWIGWVLAVWGLGSAVGGVVYGAMRRTIPLFVLLALLSVTTIPVALARDPLVVSVLLFVTGVFCAPTITASVDALSRAVPERVRGEVLGWHGAALTAGSAAGAPIAGVAVDAFGWRGGFLLPGALGLLAAAGGLILVSRQTARSVVDHEVITPEPTGARA